MTGHARTCSCRDYVLPRVALMFACWCACAVQGMAQVAAQASTAPPLQASSPSVNPVTAVPNRPTFSTTAETVQTGVFEVEYGFEAASGHQNINGLLKLGLLKDLELRFANNPFERGEGAAAMGDSAVGFKYRLAGKSGARPTIAVLYTATLPTAGDGLGSRALQHAVGVLVSKDFGRHHLDFNEIAEWRGRPAAGGFDRDIFTAFAYSYLLTARLGISAEIGGFSRVNAATPSSLTILQALTYNVSGRLVLDGGAYVAARGNLPRVTVFAGVTYSVADLYRYLHLARH